MPPLWGRSLVDTCFYTDVPLGLFTQFVSQPGSVRKRTYPGGTLTAFWQLRYKHAALTGLRFLLENAAINISSYGTEEGFEISKFSVQNPVRLGMQIAFGRVRRKTAP